MGQCPIWTWGCCSEHWGLSWQAVGSWQGDRQSPPATNSVKNLVGREAARPRSRTLPRKQLDHTLAAPPSLTIHLPQILAPQGRAAIENQQEGNFQPVSVSGSGHFYTPWTHSEYSSPQRQKSHVYKGESKNNTTGPNHHNHLSYPHCLISKGRSVTLLHLQGQLGAGFYSTCLTTRFDAFLSPGWSRPLRAVIFPPSWKRKILLAAEVRAQLALITFG